MSFLHKNVLPKQIECRHDDSIVTFKGPHSTPVFYELVFLTYFVVLKNIAQPSTCFLSNSDMVLARDFGAKIPS